MSQIEGIISNRGDITAETGASLAAEIHRIDPSGELRIVIAGGAPCPDYSRITEGPGREGEQGQLFAIMCDLLDDLLPRLVGRTVGLLVENVFMNAYGDINYFNGRLKGDAVLVDAADFGLVSRPRLWWTRVDWSKCTAFRWSRSGKIHRLHVKAERDDLAQLDLRGFALSKEVASGLQTLPCFTTPAPTESGRSAPKRMKTRIDSASRQRWLDDSRTFAPWHYQEAAMVASPDGKLQVVPPFLKEQAHHLPPDFTKNDMCSDRDRHRLLGNSWHKGVASFLFKIVLDHGMFVVEDHSARPADPSQSSSIKEVFAWARSLQLPITRVKTPVFVGVPPASDMWGHWEFSAHLQPAALQPLPLEPGLEVVLRTVSFIQAPALDLHRERMLGEIEHLVQSLRKDTDEWYEKAPQHVARTLQPHGHPRFEVVVFLKLLRDCGYTDVESLAEDFRTGFPLLGELRHTPGWRPRLDDTYANPISIQAFRRLNQDYIHEKLRNSRLDPHWQHMLDEVIQEVRSGRMEGPFTGPASWPKQTVGVPAHGMERIQRPEEDCFVARAFSVAQTGADGVQKIRRCEDYRRSFHNSTVQVGDRPEHDDIEVYISALRRAQALGMRPQLWCQDFSDAYRAYPVLDPSHAYLLLGTARGPTLWRHRALPFGSTASVWHFNRIADSICWLCRCLLLIVILHYVDDLGGVHDAGDAESAFRTFSRFCSILGIRLNTSKAQPPAPVQSLLGVRIEVLQNGVRVAPEPRRLEKLRIVIKEALDAGELHPETASRLAGKMAFVNSTAFGRVGAAALRPVYARASSTLGDTAALNVGLAAALRALLVLLTTMRPRFVPFEEQGITASVYTDAFFELGDLKLKPADPSVPESWSRDTALHSPNGWGFIVRIGTTITYGHGSVSTALLKRFTSRRAYIYFLEIYAQLLAFAAHAKSLPPYWTSWIDNAAGLSALEKGFGRDAHVNQLLTYFWTLAARASWVPQFEWVPSGLNLADPISRADFSVVQPHWKRLQSDTGPFGALLASLHTDRMDEAVRATYELVWNWA